MSDPQLPPYSVPPVPTPPQSAPYAAPYAAPQHPQFAQYVAAPAEEPKGRGLGLFALLLSLVAFVVTPIVAGVAAFAVGVAVGAQADFAEVGQDLSIFSPARDAVLWIEISFWAGTVLGIWAIAQGIVAVVKRRGRGPGVAAIVIGVLAVVTFALVVFTAFVAGAATSVPIGA